MKIDEIIMWVGGTIAVILIVILFTLVINNTNEMSDNIGETIVMQTDTLTIVNYRLLLKQYTLSNGLIVDRDYVHKLLEERR